MQTNWNELTIGEIVTDLPQSTNVFRAAGIDFCCGGRQKLGTVIVAQGLSDDDIQNALNDLLERKPADANADFETMSAAELAAYITDTHHAYLWESLPDTRALLLTVLKAHGRSHPELYDIYKIYGELTRDLEPHMIREENELFPSLAERGDTVARKTLIHILEEEHQSIRKTLKALRHATNDYSVPGDACDNYARLYQRLTELEDDTMEHYHLEDDILFKKILS